MGKHKRIDFFYEPHVGIGIRWQRKWTYEFELSIAFPFITFVFGFGREMQRFED